MVMGRKDPEPGDLGTVFFIMVRNVNPVFHEIGWIIRCTQTGTYCTIVTITRHYKRLAHMAFSIRYVSDKLCLYMILNEFFFRKKCP